MDNYQQVLLQMQQFGIELRDKDLPLKLDTPKSKTCGKGGKDWYKLYLFRRDPDKGGGTYVVGTFGTYRHGGASQKVDVEWAPLSPDERERRARELREQRVAAAEQRRQEIETAAAEAISVWRVAVRDGSSPYLDRKGVQGESCRYLHDPLVLRWPGEMGEDDTVIRLPAGTVVVPLLRFDFPREQALRALQFIRPDGSKIYQRGMEKPGCCVRLGAIDRDTCRLMLVVEGYATGLTARMACDGLHPVFVALDAGNLAHVVPLLRKLYPYTRILILADDDWMTKDQHTGALTNPGRSAARAIARKVEGCDHLWPIFSPSTRGEKDTDFNDLHVREGLDAVRKQLAGVVAMMVRRYG
ncbi:toprim domain-containing protein [Acidovorax sp. SUPP2825]|uniref:toprim domain-containing protein n=1 Tax=Acidovorax sp. SUPP2825 TaxID=2920879 RepID=UPI0023DE41DD|nr:toprim domain-containing protein [Acidovorax sp. SUPP2825]GKS96932.1 toprim domain-containing protein [Acidovorax sp. SUPP2825]